MTFRGELTDTQEQPETASQSQHAGNTAKASVARVSSAENDSDEISAPHSPSPANTPRLAADDEAAQANPIVVGNLSSSVTPPPPGETDKAGDVSPPSSPAVLSEADVPAFLKPEQRKSIADYRPNCLNPDACGATGLQHCYTCRKAMEAASETEAA